MKPKNKNNYWELRYGEYEIHWKDGVAVEISIAGILFEATEKRKP